MWSIVSSMLSAFSTKKMVSAAMGVGPSPSLCTRQQQAMPEVRLHERVEALQCLCCVLHALRPAHSCAGVSLLCAACSPSSPNSSHLNVSRPMLWLAMKGVRVALQDGERGKPGVPARAA